MNVSDSQLAASLIENRRDGVTNGSELAAAVRRDFADFKPFVGCLLPISGYETL